MAGITLAQAEARLTNYMGAEAAVLNGQSYEIGGRKMTRANLKEIQEGITYWDTRVKRLSTTGGGLVVRGFTPMD